MKYGVKSKPLLTAEADHFVLDELQLMMRIADALYTLKEFLNCSISVHGTRVAIQYIQGAERSRKVIYRSKTYGGVNYILAKINGVSFYLVRSCH